jgi:hypothetical protein
MKYVGNGSRNVVVTLWGNGTPIVVVTGVVGLWRDRRAEASIRALTNARVE